MVLVNKNPSVVWDSPYDEFDWFDFKYSVGMLLSKTLGTNRYVKVVAEIQNPWNGEVKQGYKYLRLDFARDCDDYALSLLVQIFPREIGSLKVYRLKNRKGLMIKHTHHDNPVNGDTYYVYPSCEAKYRKFHCCT